MMRMDSHHFRCLGRGHIASECPTKKLMILLDDGNVVSDDEEGGQPSDVESVEEYAPEGEALMIRRLLGNQAQELEHNQRENIFHTRCTIQGKVCSLIIDGGSCTNVASARMVSKLGLTTKPHPKPYKLQWLSEAGELVVGEQVELKFHIGKYQDTILCDVVPMDATHVLLGRPWQFDKGATHDGRTNKYSFLHNKLKVTLVPLSPKEVSIDQMNMREKKEQEEKSETLVRTKKSETLERKKSEKHERKHNYFAKGGEVKRAMVSQQPLYLLYSKELCLNSNVSNLSNLPSIVEKLLQEFEDVFP